jgi:DHA2 family multidrug resistance protein
MKALFMSQGSSSATATKQAYQSIWGMVQRQAAMLSYNDTFFFMALMFVAMIPFLFLLRKPKPGKAGLKS